LSFRFLRTNHDKVSTTKLGPLSTNTITFHWQPKRKNNKHTILTIGYQVGF